MLGDEVYLARFLPGDANNGSAWEFYSGGHGSDATWSQGSVALAKPLVVWNNHTGVVTMTYHPTIKKYVYTADNLCLLETVHCMQRELTMSSAILPCLKVHIGNFHCAPLPLHD